MSSTDKDAGLRPRHARSCGGKAGGRCSCKPRWQAEAYDKQAGRRLTKTFETKTAAKKWRVDAQSALRAGTLTADRGDRLEDAMSAWLEGARTGVVLTRSQDRFKPSTLRNYERDLRLRVWPKLGAVRVNELETKHVQLLVDELVTQGLAPGTIATTLGPLKAFYRRAVARGDARVNPTRGLEKPAVRSKLKLTASPQEAAAMVALLEGPLRVIWGLGFYAGLRRGEVAALRWEDVDLQAGVLRISRNWDAVHGEIAPKSFKGTRSVPIAAALRSILVERRLATKGDERVVPNYWQVERASEKGQAVWREANREALGEDVDAPQLPLLVLHGARHTFASMMIAAGVNAKALSTYMGHANIGITMDVYGHLMPGNEAEAAQLFDDYLRRASGDA